MKFITKYYRIWLPLLMVIVAAVLAYYIYNSSGVERRNRGHFEKSTRVVNVSPLAQSTVEPTWQASGVVIPAESVNVLAEVSGNIIALNEKAKPGALLAKNEWLVEIDQTNYQLNLQSQQAAHVQAQANYDLELAERKLAKEELSFVDNVDQSMLENALVLREPQFKSVEAKLLAATVNVEKAQVDLARTKISMPFRGKIIQRGIGRGSRVGSNSSLFSIVNVDVFWLEVKVPRYFLTILNQQKTVTISQEGIWGKGKTRQATIISVLPELDSKDRQAKVLLAITDPLNTQSTSLTTDSPPVFINDFVNVELKGHEIENAWTINSFWLQADNTIWVVDKANTLRKRKVEILFKGREFIYVSGDFQAGDFALNEKPGIAAVGMPVKPRQEENQATEQAEKKFPAKKRSADFENLSDEEKEKLKQKRREKARSESQSRDRGEGGL